MVDIIVGRGVDDVEKFGKEGTIFLGKEYIKMENVISLSNNVYLDVNNPHLILICGKRGTGKSYTLAVIAEELSMLPEELRSRISVLIYDTMGIFWTMKFPNFKDVELLGEWGLKPVSLKVVRTFIPIGHITHFEEMGIPFDFTFSIDPSDLSPQDWLLVFGIKPKTYLASFIATIIKRIKEREVRYSLQDIIKYIEDLKSGDPKLKSIAGSLFENAETWGIFSSKSHNLEFVVEAGSINVLDLSLFTTFHAGWSVKNLVIGYLSRKIFFKRILYRKREELEAAERGEDIIGKKWPIVWIMIDEAHEVLPKKLKTPATDALIQIIREGRQPGISLVLATQQPGKIHTDVLTQSDIVIAHRVTSKMDLEALNNIMRNFAAEDIERYMNRVLPKRKGAALLLDDKSERIIPIQVRPRVSWHGGADPSILG